MKGCWGQMPFLCQLRWLYHFFLFHSINMCLIFFQLIWFFMLNHPCISGVNPWCIVLLIQSWICFANFFFLRILASIFIRRLICSSLDVFVFGRVKPASCNESGKYSFLYFLEEFEKNWWYFYFFFKCLAEFISGTMWPLTFLCQKF